MAHNSDDGGGGGWMIHECEGGSEKLFEGVEPKGYLIISNTTCKSRGKDDTTASTTGRSYVDVGTRETAPIERSNQVRLMARYMLEVEVRVWTFLYLDILVPPLFPLVPLPKLSFCLFFFTSLFVYALLDFTWLHSFCMSVTSPWLPIFAFHI